MDSIPGYTTLQIFPVVAASDGGEKESIDSIKFQAPKAFSSQGRAVSKNDYITAIQQNTLGYSFDAVNVWGGEENNPVVYGQVFVCLKPSGSYSLTQTQKQRLIAEVIKPISVLTVTPNIVDPDYTYIQVNASVYYTAENTNLTAAQLTSGVISAIQTWGNSALNTFNSTFNSYDLLSTIQSYNQSIVSSEFNVKLQKKILPNLGGSTTYKLYYNTPIEIGKFGSGITSYPDLQYRDPTNLSTIIDGIYIEEVPSSTYGVDMIDVINPGYGYQSAPTVTILGDGSGATATASIVNGSISKITVVNSGNNYTQAIATITPASGDTTGQLGAVVVNLQGRYGTLRTYYNNANQVKTIFDSNIGTIDYLNGVITLESFNPYGVNDPLGQLTISVTPTTNIISSSYNRIITIDPFDSNAIKVKVTVKTTT